MGGLHKPFKASGNHTYHLLQQWNSLQFPHKLSSALLPQLTGLVVARFCEHGNESSGSMKGAEFADWLTDRQLLKKPCIPWS